MSFIGDIFSGAGEIEEGQSFNTAGNLEEQNVGLQKQINAVNTSQIQRQVYQALGTEQAGVAGAGLKMGGSEASLLASSRYQGALQTQAVKTQGIIQENAYAAQAQAYYGQGQAMMASGAGSIASGVLGIFGI